MRFAEIAKTVEKFSIDNSPALLTAFGVAGTISGAVLAARAGMKATEVLENERLRKSVSLTGVPDSPFSFTAKEKVKLTWPLFVPAAGAVVLSCGAIVGANQISTRRAAAVASAYAISEKAWTEYRDKVIEKLGENKDREVRDAVAQDRVTRTSDESREVIIASGKVLCRDDFSGRYFESTMEDLKAAQNGVNFQLINDCFASLSDLYDQLRLSHTSVSDEVGWNASQPLELQISAALTDDGKPCLSIGYSVLPVRDYYRMH